MCGNAKGSYGNTALITASQKGWLDVVQALLAANADVNAKDQDVLTALDWASASGPPRCGATPQECRRSGGWQTKTVFALNVCPLQSLS